jgi:DNA topoisomerase-2
MTSKKTQSKKYEKKDPIDHILLRPDMYVGSTRTRKVEEYVAEYNDDNYKITKENIDMSPAILRIFLEPLYNATDNVERSRKTKTPCTKIQVNINEETGETSIWNDGDIIPIEINEEQNCYNHTLIFGHLLTSSNYDDEEERLVSGRNGLGGKLCLKKGTRIPLYNGTILNIEDINIGDILIGDDGNKRIVKDKCEGKGRLFEVKQEYGMTYIVNENHILSLHFPEHKKILISNNELVVRWIDKINKSINTKVLRNVNNKYYNSNEDDEKKLNTFLKDISDDNTIDISIQEYLKLDEYTKEKLNGFFGKSKMSLYNLNELCYESSGRIEIKEVEEGEYIGLEVDKNHRFVLEDYTVTHNCNVFSSYFKVKGQDPNVKKELTQVWKNNMKLTDGPEVNKIKSGKGYTEISWIPDFKQFKINGYTKDIIKLYTRYVIDISMITKVPVYLNGKLIPVKNLQEYAKLYTSPSDEQLLIKIENSEVLITTSNEFQAISFVNGVYTRLGGRHVDAWSEELFRPLVNKFNKKDKPQINIRDIKQFFRLFIVSTVINPEFDGQDKNKLESPNVIAEVKPLHISKIMKWSVYEQITNMLKAKEMVVLKKSETKTRGYKKIEGLDPANNSGTKYSTECTLIICEGLSAKTYAVAGIQKGVYGKTGRDWFGIYPIRGKLINVRNKTPSLIAKNREVTDLIQAIGLKYGIDYTIDDNYKTLRYGRVMIMTDADVDGIHIEGLVMNFFHSLFPTLFQRENPFLVSMKTPIVRVFRNKIKDLLFFDERKFKEYQSQQTKKFESKYYKGLGSSKSEDVPDTFGVKMIEFVNDEKSLVNMNKAFFKNNSDDRKSWLTEYDCKIDISLDDVGEIYKMKMSDFIDGELIKFSLSDCKRSIPSGIDGLKESQRKILYAVKKRKLKYSGKTLKVAQLGGYVAEHTNYHHGEQNLYDTITKMANEFPGSNNIPLFYRDGQFGTRLQGGKDAASARYIFTKMDMLTHLIFREEDDDLLEQVIDDGDLVEPIYYVPIIPMILCNGCVAGIGTGWSCNVPCYNPLDLIECIKVWLDNDGEVMMEEENICLLPEIIPWYRGFEGEIEKTSTTGKYITYGKIEDGPKNTKIVTELPIGLWTEKFKENIEDYLENKKIKDMKNYSTPKQINFVLSETKDGLTIDIENLKLYTYVYTSNMVLFNEKSELYKYNKIQEIINNFCKVRYDFYIKRKKKQISELEKEIKFLGNKERFVSEVINGDLKVMKIKEDILIKNLENKGYDKYYKNEIDNTNEDIDINVTTSSGYEYLLRLQVRTFTLEKVQSLKNDILSKKTELTNLIKISEKDIWLSELKEFEEQYKIFLNEIDNNKTEDNKPTKTKGKRTK